LNKTSGSWSTIFYLLHTTIY